MKEDKLFTRLPNSFRLFLSGCSSRESDPVPDGPQEPSRKRHAAATGAAERGCLWKRWADRWLGIPMVGIGAVWRRLECQLRKKAALELHGKPERIGVLCFGAIGDTLLASASIVLLHQEWPQAKILLITSRANAGAALFVPHVTETRAFTITDVWGMIRYVRQCRFDLFMDTGQWARLGALISALSGAGRTVGFCTPGQFRHIAFDIRVPHRNDQHEIENFLALGQAFRQEFGKPSRPLTSPVPALKAPEPALPPLVADFAGSAPLVACHMWPAGIQANLKEWPPAYWAQLTEKLTAAGIRVLFTGGPGDVARTTAFVDAYIKGPTREKILPVAGTMSLYEEAALLQKLNALIAVNTGYMHLGALLGVPTVDLHGPTNPRRWGGIGPRVIRLLPEKGHYAYLNLGFEYPPHAENVLRYLPPQAIIDALRSFGEPFEQLR